MPKAWNAESLENAESQANVEPGKCRETWTP
jgi:hypothetical protein